MQVNYNTGEMKLINAADVSPRVVKEAQDDPAVTSYAFHKPGSVVEMRDKRRYEVQKDGSWRVLNKPISRRKKRKLGLL